MRKEEIYKKIEETQKINEMLSAKLIDSVLLTDYIDLVKIQDGRKIWTDAFQKALDEHEIIHIKKNDEPYYIDKSLVIPSNRRIESDDGAVIKLVEDVKVLLIRNKDAANGSRMPITKEKNKNISIIGGVWEESHLEPVKYRESGIYNEDGSFYGVWTCMLLNNIENLTVKNVTFVHTGGFALQTGNVKNVIFENITFIDCFADGLHINGNTENLLVRNIKGQVGDDLVALNMYDWDGSSVTFGPMKTVVCEDIKPADNSVCKALRILPGQYYYDDGSCVDCSANNIIIKDVKGINTFKLYLQTPCYKIGKKPDNVGVGSADNIYFENIDIDLKGPANEFSEYMTSDKIKGSFAAFELGAMVGNISFENVKLKIYKEKWPMSFLVCVGPKSVNFNDELECFDPYVDCVVENIYFKDIYVNGKKTKIIDDLVQEIHFDDVNCDGQSSGCGKIKNYVLLDKI